MEFNDKDYFMTLLDLRFDNGEELYSEEMLNALDGWIPRGKGIFARLENRWRGRDYFDYVLITDDLVYFAILSGQNGRVEMRSLKCFKSSDMEAFAFIIGAMEQDEEAFVPQIRLMMRDGKRIKLILDQEHQADAIVRMKELSTKNFFTC